MNLWHARSFSTRGRARERKTGEREPAGLAASAARLGKSHASQIAGLLLSRGSRPSHLQSALSGLQSESGRGRTRRRRRYQSHKTWTGLDGLSFLFAHFAVACRVDPRCHLLSTFNEAVCHAWWYSLFVHSIVSFRLQNANLMKTSHSRQRPPARDQS